MARFNYTLEWFSGGRLLRAFAIPLVSSLQWTREEATTIRWTLGDDPSREHTGIRGQIGVLSGRSGQAARLGSSRTGSRKFAPGSELFREFDAFLKNYQLAAVDAERRGAPDQKMLFRADNEEVHDRVEPQRAIWKRGTGSSRHSYEWSLQFLSYGKASAAENRLALINRGELVNVLDDAKSSLDSVRRFVQKGSTLTADLAETVDLIGSFARIYEPVLRDVRQLGAALQLLGTATDRVTFAPIDLVDEAAVTAESVTAGVFSIWSGLPLTDRNASRAAMIEVIGAIRGVRDTAVEAIGAHWLAVGDTPPPLQRRFSSESVERRGLNVAAIELNEGEDLQDVAGRVLGDRTRWPEIAAQNGMTGPTILNFGSPIYPGAIIFVELGSVESGTGSIPATPQQPFGTDLALGADGDLIIVGTAMDDVATISGLPNLKQALTLRLTAEQGDHGLHPSWGLPPLVGEPNEAGTPAELASQVRSQIEMDDRIREVRGLSVVDDNDALTVECEAVTASGIGVAMTVPVGG